MSTRLKAIDGVPVLDAKRPIELIITENDIAKADVKEPADCAAARACRRQLHAVEARVHLGRVYVKMNGGNWTRYVTTSALRAEIVAFDRGGKFESGTYTLNPPPKSQKLGAKRTKGPKLTKGKKRRKPHVITNVRGGPAF